jgi:hypothetical protein
MTTVGYGDYVPVTGGKVELTTRAQMFIFSLMLTFDFSLVLV